MTLTESIVSDAIRYSMRKFCFANIILAGPIGAGKKSIAQLIVQCADIKDSTQNVTIFEQDSYYREFDELEDTPFGVKNIDVKSAFNTKRFVNDVRTLYEKGTVSVAAYNRKKWTKNWGTIETRENEFSKPTCIFETKYERRINLFVGPHAIELLTPRMITDLQSVDLENYVIPYRIPEVICIYLNTNHDICMARREKEHLMFPEIYEVKKYQEYSRFVEEQTMKEIAAQKGRADIILNCN